MPTYVYRCDSCSHQFELVQRMSDDPIEICPNCGNKVRRVIFPVGVVFKGSGWYINDSRAKNSTTMNGSEPSTATAKENGGTPESSSKDAKTDTATPTKTAAD